MGRALEGILKKHCTIGLDTPVLIYHFEDVPPYSDLTERLFAAAGKGKVELLVPALCITEFLVKPWEKGEREAEKALSLLLELPNARFIAVGIEAAAEAARLRSRYKLRTPDAILLAAAKGGGATAFLTNDRGFLKVREGIEIVVLDDLLKGK